MKVDSKIIFSKMDLINCESERFPHEGEILDLISKM
ncbi:hypothetical protein CQA75_07985 [Campylobacter taeniopygiae]|uniref:Uncharacterized protein n=1 Tax=Campylobacter taeniopygiae TaxID=2510188 RepID=A0ABY2TLR7_9BACT|nr:hypothetical protein CQA75_07985 [Campylobacter taeniopygiae]